MEICVRMLGSPLSMQNPLQDPKNPNSNSNSETPSPVTRASDTGCVRVQIFVLFLVSAKLNRTEIYNFITLSVPHHFDIFSGFYFFAFLIVRDF